MFLWRHIHVGEINAEDIDSDEDKEEKEDDADDLMEQSMERVQQDQEEDGSETVDGETVKDKAEEKKLTRQQRCGSTSCNPLSTMFKK